MKPRKPLLKSLLGKLRKTSAAAAPEPPARPVRREPSPRKVVSSIEGLEGRIAPATLVSPAMVTYTDVDGDLVTVKFSKNLLTSLATANGVFDFNTGSVQSGADATAQQLWLLDLSSFGAAATGLSISISATAAGGGNGVADVGAIRATNVSLGKVTIDGDFAQIDAGRVGVKTALAALEVGSLGVRGLDTQDPASTTREIISTLRGTLGSLVVHGDVKEARVNVINGTASGGITPLGNIGTVIIEGSLLGRTAAEAASNNTGKIDATGNIGSVRIGTDASEGIFGGGGEGSGQVTAAGKLGNVTVSGRLVGGAGLSSGTIFSTNTMGAVKIGLDATGGIDGGTGGSSGTVQAGGSMTSVFINGDVSGGTAIFAGSILTSSGSIGRVTITGDLAGGSGENSGRVQAGVTLSSISIGDDLIAGTGENSGGISASLLGTVTLQDIDGRTANAGLRSGGIAGGKLNSLSVTGSIFGGGSGQTGYVEIAGDIGSVTVRGDIVGGAGDASASVLALGKVAGVTVNGNLLGGAGFKSGQIVSGDDPVRVGDMGVVKVLGRVEGGVGDFSGSIRSGGLLKSVLLGTAGAAQPDVLKGGSGDRSGSVESQGLLGSVKIVGNLVGGAGDFSGSVRSADRFEATAEIAGDLGVVTITGQLRGGSGEGAGGLYADGNLSALTAGAWAGGTGEDSGVLRTGLGIVKPGHSGAIKVLGAFAEEASPGADSASVVVGGNLSSVFIGGGATGATVRVGDALGGLTIRGDASDVLATARGQVTQGRTTDVAIGAVSITGNVTDSEILAGYRIDGLAVNGDAQIGSVLVTGNWTRSSIVAGVLDADADGVGDGDDEAIAGGSATIFSRIASIVIGGAVTGTAQIFNDHFGFTAEQVVRMKVGTFNFPLTAAGGEIFEQDTTGVNGALGSTANDVSIREVVRVI